jgi:uncharacterized membrane protein
LRFDWLGALFLSLAVGAPLAGVELLTNMGKSSQWLWGLALLFMGIAAAFILVRIEKNAPTPIFPLRVLETKESRLLNLAGLLAGAVMFILIFYLPLLLQEVLKMPLSTCELCFQIISSLLLTVLRGQNQA